LRRLFTLVLTAAMVILRKAQTYNYPLVVYVEPTNICNLQCPGCPTGVGLPSGRDKSFLTFGRFRLFLDQIKDFVYSVNFSNWGEPLLSPYILQMVKYAHTHGIRTCMDTNLNVELDETKASAMVRSGLDLITVALDGFHQSTYEIYRRRGNIDLVKRNIKTLVAVKQRLGSKTPEIECRFLIFSHNRDDRQSVEDFARQVGARFVSAYGRRPSARYDPIPDEVYSPKYPACIFLWTIAVLNADGGLAPCCVTYYKKDDYGLVARGFNFRESWNGKRFLYSRALFSRVKAVRRHACEVLTSDNSPCLRCHYFKKTSDRYGMMGIL
jgi:MoaA/NifB/PqqE/SkfB family radical SAM enzyme